MLDTFGIKKGVEIACFTNLLMFKKLLGHFNNLIFIISIIVATLGFFFGISPNHLVCLIHRKRIILSQRRKYASSNIRTLLFPTLRL